MVNLPRLRILRLQGLGFWLVTGFLEKVLLGCPMLEDLSLSLPRFDVWTIFVLLSEKLKEQTILKLPGAFIQCISREFSHLYFSRSAEALARLINRDLPSIFDANILFHINQPLEIASYLSILSGLSNVEMLRLCMHIQNLNGFDMMHQLVLSSTLANLDHIIICGLFASDGFYYFSGLWQYAPNLSLITLCQSCSGCLFHKVGVDDWQDKSCVVSAEKMEAWGNELSKCKKLKMVHISIPHYNDKVGHKVHAFFKCWRKLKYVQIRVTD